LTKELKCSPSQRLTIAFSTDVQASIFQAYVGAVFQESGVGGVTSWIGPLIQPIIDMDKDNTNNNNGGYSGLAASNTSEIATNDNHHQPLKGSTSQAPSPPVIVPSGNLSLLNETFQRYGVPPEQIEWKITPTGPSHQPTWKVDVYAPLGDAKEFLGSGVGSRKQGAKEEAAKQALQMLKTKPHVRHPRQLRMRIGAYQFLLCLHI
jgi:dsRNA-specific ribonuclease